MALLFRANSLAKGVSGIRSLLLERLIALVNSSDLYPYVPKIGSLGASGDLSPLSHIAYNLIGEGQIFVRLRGTALNEEALKGDVLEEDGSRWRLQPTGPALAAAGLEPIILEEKEGLAMNNGMQVSLAAPCFLAAQARSCDHRARMVRGS